MVQEVIPGIELEKASPADVLIRVFVVLDQSLGMGELSVATFAICLIAKWDHVNSKSMAVRKLPYILVRHSHSPSSASHNSKSCNSCSIPKIFMRDTGRWVSPF